MAEAAPTRREITRQRTLEEIRGLAEEQVKEGGVESVSLNAIAKSMGMSGPAIYRYFASRDELITDLVDAGYIDLTQSVADAILAVADQPPEERLRALARAYYGWATSNPHRFAMFYPVRIIAPVDVDHTTANAQQTMTILLILLTEIEDAAKLGKKRGPKSELEKQLQRWIDDRRVTGDFSPLVLKLGILAWTRLHGIVELELAGAFQDMGVDASLLCEQEIDWVIAQVRAG